MLDLPMKIAFSNIGKMRMIVPWSKLSSSPVEIYLDDIYIIAELIEKSKWQIDDRSFL